MEKSSLITFGVCVAIATGSIGWLMSGEPLPAAQQNKPVKSIVDETSTQSGQKVFKIAAPRATALNNEPVNIIIEPGSNTAPIPVNSGTADLVVSSSRLRMRSEPNSRSQTLGQYNRGAKFALIEDKRGWVLVQSLEDGRKGWMFKKYMKAGG
jgi:uncharacterized protein YgiM (DUF1202 family)